MIDRIIWHTCQGELNAGPEELQIYITGIVDGFDHMATWYFNEKILEMDKWTAEKIYAVLNHIANMKTITATTLEPNTREIQDKLNLGGVLSKNTSQLMPKLQHFLRKVENRYMFLEIFMARHKKVKKLQKSKHLKLYVEHQ